MTGGERTASLEEMRAHLIRRVARPVLVVLLAGIVGDAHLPAGEVRAGGAAAPTGPLALGRTDPDLRRGLVQSLRSLGLERIVWEGRLGVALVDLTDPAGIRYAGVNDDVMMYAASLPKIAVLLAAFEKIQSGDLPATPLVLGTLTDMIRFSNNEAATRAISWVGLHDIAKCVEQPRYSLYDRHGSGGLWVGKAYDETPAVYRDPLFDLSHGATARQAARFFVLLDRGLLVGPQYSRQMREILGDPGIQNKFVKGLEQRPGARIYRKSGTWRRWHSDAALVERNGHRYVAAALVEDVRGSEILERLILTLDDLVQAHPVPLHPPNVANPPYRSTLHEVN